MSGAEARRAWESGVIAGKFPLRERLGSSEHSTVFVTERQQGQVSQKAAIKLIAAGAGDAERQLSRWRAASQLSHPNLIRIFEAGRCELDGTPLLYVVMEYADENLSQILPQRPLTPTEAADLLPPVLSALSYLHEKGFVHGDIRPSNLLAIGDELKLSADQIISFADEKAAPSRRDVYDAPETAEGVVSSAGDLWALGVTLVAALTQNAPSAGEEPASALETLPEPFRGIARECLRLDPKRRCSIAQIRARLQPPGRSVPAESEPIPPPRPTRRRPALVAGLVSMALIVGLVLFYARGRSVPSPSAVTPGLPSASTPATSVPEPARPKEKAASQGDVLRQVLPDVPQSALNTITGTIKITARVEADPSGKVVAAKLTSPGPSRYFAGLTLQAAQRWEFTPPEVNGQPVASTWQLRFRLRRTSMQASAERLTH